MDHPPPRVPLWRGCAESDIERHDAAAGAGASKLRVRNVSVWLWGPQVRVTYGRTWTAAKPSPVLDLPDPYQPGAIGGEVRPITEPSVRS